MTYESARVFVDDYIGGRTPDRCVYTGQPTPDRLTVSTEIDGPSPAWFVLLLFPLLGWLVLVLVLATAKRSYLTGTLPVSAEAYEALRRRRRAARLAAVGGFVGLILSFTPWLGAARGVIAAIALVCFVGGLVAHMIIDARSPKIVLDASRRWVTITRVHPGFAGAIPASHSEEIIR